ncbi:MAG TPA: hypothetical protein VNJ07_12995 [Chitinophagales bacterium]|nr:hypothetical protein [Chitinophagales bacterium]
MKDIPVVRLIHRDFFKHQGRYDLIIEQTFFCAINPKPRPAKQYSRTAQ